MTDYEQSPDYGAPDPTWKGALVLIMLIAAFVGADSQSLATAQPITPGQYHAQVGPCACPYDQMVNGRG